MEETKEFQGAELFQNLETICKNLQKRRKCLNSALSLVDKKKTDIEHYIEFNNLSASQGYKAAKLLKDCLEERRRIKNELEQIGNVSRMSIGFIGNGNMRNVLKRTNGKQYTPRVLTELFDSE